MSARTGRFASKGSEQPLPPASYALASPARSADTRGAIFPDLCRSVSLDHLPLKALVILSFSPRHPERSEGSPAARRGARPYPLARLPRGGYAEILRCAQDDRLA